MRAANALKAEDSVVDRRYGPRRDSAPRRTSPYLEPHRPKKRVSSIFVARRGIARSLNSEMGYGRSADWVAGKLSRVLHLRKASHNTLADLGLYLDLSPEQLFPAPPAIEDMDVHRSLAGRLLCTTTLQWKSSHRVLSHSYRERHEGPYKKNLTAWARWVRPKNNRTPDQCLVYVHGWLEPGSWIEETTLFRKWGKELDADLLHVALPFHGKRCPPSALFSGEFFWTADLVRSIEGVRQAVCDVRALMAWLRKQGYKRVGITGISLGGAIAMMLACIEPSPDFIIPIIAHLELEDAIESAPILWRMKSDLERFGVHSAKRRELFTRLGLSHFVPMLSPEKQLWIEAREDLYIDARLVEKQWNEWKQPQILWIHGGHITFPLHLDTITKRIASFLAAG